MENKVKRYVIMAKLCFLCIGLAVIPQLSFATTNTTEGTEFWLTFLQNYQYTNNYVVYDSRDHTYDTLQLSIFISSRFDNTIHISAQNWEWDTTLTISANESNFFKFPLKKIGYKRYLPIGYVWTNDTLSKPNGVFVSSTYPISLYAFNYAPATFDGTNVLPITSLGTDYVIPSREVLQNLLYPEFAVVATEDNTKLSIHYPNSDDIVTSMLNKGEVLLNKLSEGGKNVQGTVIHADKPIAVFVGHECVFIPIDCQYCDHIVEQLMPSRTWGKQFVVTRALTQNTNIVMLTTNTDNTHIKIHIGENKIIDTIINAKENYEYYLEKKCCYIETSQPVECFLYFVGSTYEKGFGDPSMIHISPIEQGLSTISFNTTNTGNIGSKQHYINIVTTKYGYETMQLMRDATTDNLINISQFKQVPNTNGEYYYATFQTPPAFYTITSLDKFSGYAYGLGRDESYGYNFGNATNNLLNKNKIRINGNLHEHVTCQEQFCLNEPITFLRDTFGIIRTPYDTIIWDFGDGTKAEDTKDEDVIHQYSASGTYPIQLIVKNKEYRDTVTTTICLASTIFDTIYRTICANEVYSFYGEDYNQTGIYQDSFGTGGCTGIHVLDLTVLPVRDTTIYRDICSGDTYRFKGKYYSQAGDYVDTFTSYFSCDSVVHLHLSLLPSTNDTIIEDTICQGQIYERDDFIYNYNEPGHYFIDTFYMPNYFGCDSSGFVYLTVLPTYNNVLNTSICSTDSIIWQGSVYKTKGNYTKTFITVNGCDSIFTLNLTLLPSTNDTVIEDTICQGQVYKRNGLTYNEPGRYIIDSFNTLNSFGCDSSGFVYLTVLPTYNDVLNTSICSTDSIIWQGSVYKTKGNYTKTFITVNGCDSIFTLNLTLLPSTNDTVIEDTICQGQVYKRNGLTYNEPGHYIIASFNTLNSFGCDSSGFVYLTVLPTYNDVLDTSICSTDSIIWQGSVYKTKGNYTKVFTTVSGCDSILTLNLNVLSCHYDTVIYDTICQGKYFLQNGKKYTQANVYVDTFKNVDGFDSIVKLYLTTMPTFHIDDSVTICNGTFYMWNDKQYTSPGAYTDTLHTSFGCDSITSLYISVAPTYFNIIYDTVFRDETYEWQGNIYTEPGLYIYNFPTVNYCDSTEALFLYMNFRPYTDITTTSYKSEDVSIHPSILPPGAVINITTPDRAIIHLYDITGSLIKKGLLQAGPNTFTAPESTGLYFIRILLNPKPPIVKTIEVR